MGIVKSRQQLIGEQDQKIFIGLFSFNSVGLIQVLSLPALSTALYSSAMCFSAAMPMLAVLIFIKQYEFFENNEYQDPETFKSPAAGIAYFLSVVISYAGIVCIFFHLSWIHGAVFILASFFAIYIFYQFYRREK